MSTERTEFTADPLSRWAGTEAQPIVPPLPRPRLLYRGACAALTALRGRGGPRCRHAAVMDLGALCRVPLPWPAGAASLQ